MKAFTAKFQVHNLDLGVIITPMDDYGEKYKVEMVTGEPNPVTLMHLKDEWIVENPGDWPFSEKEFEKVGECINVYVNKIISMKTVLVLTDFSDAALNAARYAAGLTNQLEASNLIFYHSYASTPVPAYIPISIPSDTIDLQRESLEELNSLKKNIQSLASKDTAIEIRTDERQLISAVKLISEQQNVGLVVMGITGKSDLEQIMVGSNAISVAKECSVPLLIVPKEAEFKSIQRILFACDLKKVIKTIPVQTIKTFIHALKAKLFILNVDYNGRDFTPESIAEQTALHAIWDSENPEYHYINYEDTAEGIMKFANEHDIQLVITIPKKYGFFESLFHRSLTKKLAYHTTIPLLLLEEPV